MSGFRIITVGLCVAAIGAVILTAAEEHTGWFTDQACAKAGQFTGTEHQKHIAAGQPLVFVTEKDKQIRLVANPERFLAFIGEKVIVTGTPKADGSFEVELAKKASETIGQN